VNLICKNCHIILVEKESGLKVLETTENYEPYCLWLADLYACKICGEEIYQLNPTPLAQRYEYYFERYIKEGDPIRFEFMRYNIKNITKEKTELIL